MIPLAYYAISLRHHPEIGFSEFWWNMVTKGPWPSGPIWFLWVLFAFDLVACLLYRLSPHLLDPINRLSLHGRRRPAVFFAVMLAVTAAFYVPGLVHYGPASWFEFGPFSVQHGRVMLYATYFFFGAGIGVAQMDRGLLAADGRMAKVSWDWMVLAIVPYCLLWVLIFIKREILGNPTGFPDWYEALYAICFTVFSVAIMFLILAYFLRFKQSGWGVRSDRCGRTPTACSWCTTQSRCGSNIGYLATTCRRSRKRQSNRVYGRVQLGADARIAADPRSGQGDLIAHVGWFPSM